MSFGITDPVSEGVRVVRRGNGLPEAEQVVFVEYSLRSLQRSFVSHVGIRNILLISYVERLLLHKDVGGVNIANGSWVGKRQFIGTDSNNGTLEAVSISQGLCWSLDRPYLTCAACILSDLQPWKLPILLQSRETRAKGGPGTFLRG